MTVNSKQVLQELKQEYLSYTDRVETKPSDAPAIIWNLFNSPKKHINKLSLIEFKHLFKEICAPPQKL